MLHNFFEILRTHFVKIPTNLKKVCVCVCVCVCWGGGGVLHSPTLTWHALGNRSMVISIKEFIHIFQYGAIFNKISKDNLQKKALLIVVLVFLKVKNYAATLSTRKIY